jgi:CBS domain-containing protein
MVTSWDLTRAVAEGKNELADIITKKVYTIRPEETLEAASRKLAQHHISALPVVDHKKKVVGLITSEDIAKLRGR